MWGKAIFGAVLVLMTQSGQVSSSEAALRLALGRPPEPPRGNYPGGPTPPRQSPIQCAQPRPGDPASYACQLSVKCDHARCDRGCLPSYDPRDVRAYNACLTACDQVYTLARRNCPR